MATINAIIKDIIRAGGADIEPLFFRICHKISFAARNKCGGDDFYKYREMVLEKTDQLNSTLPAPLAAKRAKRSAEKALRYAWVEYNQSIWDRLHRPTKSQRRKAGTVGPLGPWKIKQWLPYDQFQKEEHKRKSAGGRYTSQLLSGRTDSAISGAIERLTAFGDSSPSVTAIAAEAGISRATFYAWRRRQQQRRAQARVEGFNPRPFFCEKNVQTGVSSHFLQNAKLKEDSFKKTRTSAVIAAVTARFVVESGKSEPFQTGHNPTPTIFSITTAPSTPHCYFNPPPTGGGGAVLRRKKAETMPKTKMDKEFYARLDRLAGKK